MKTQDDYSLYWNKAGEEAETTEQPQEGPTPRPDPRVRESAEMAKAFDGPDPEPSMESKPQKPESFSDAFKRARGLGLKSFDWNGKRYTTQLKDGAKRKAETTSGPRHSPPVKMGLGMPQEAQREPEIYIPKKSKR